MLDLDGDAVIVRASRHELMGPPLAARIGRADRGDQIDAAMHTLLENPRDIVACGSGMQPVDAAALDRSAAAAAPGTEVLLP